MRQFIKSGSMWKHFTWRTSIFKRRIRIKHRTRLRISNNVRFRQERRLVCATTNNTAPNSYNIHIAWLFEHVDRPQKRRETRIFNT